MSHDDGDDEMEGVTLSKEKGEDKEAVVCSQMSQMSASGHGSQEKPPIVDPCSEDEEPGVALAAPDLAAPDLAAPDLAAAAAAAAQVLWDEALAASTSEGPAGFPVNPG